MKRLIVNGDDFGYTRGVNRAIVEAYRYGIVTSTSLLANGAAFDDAAGLARHEPGLDVGCHLNFVEGRPVSPPQHVPHLVRGDGTFHSAPGLALRLLAGSVPAAELEREAAAQIEKLLGAGIQPSHVDTHKHTHVYPTVASAIARTARQFSIRWVRRPFENAMPPISERFFWRALAVAALNGYGRRFERRMAALGLCLPNFFTGMVLTGKLTKPALERTLRILKPGVTELMCHPGYCDPELEASRTRLKHEREREFEAVADGTWRAKLAEWGIVLTRFRELLSPRVPVPENSAPAASAQGMWP